MRERSAAGGIFRVVGRILLILLVTILLFAVFLLGVMGVLIHGPSAEAERLFVLSVNETSALKFLPHIYLSDAQVDAILHPVSTSTDDEPSPDDNFVEMPYEDGRTVEDENTNAGQVVVADPSENTGESGEWLEVVDIKGSTFKGKLMIIRDPSKVVVGTLDAYGANYHGLYLYEFIDKYNAIGARTPAASTIRAEAATAASPTVSSCATAPLPTAIPAHGISMLSALTRIISSTSETCPASRRSISG